MRRAATDGVRAERGGANGMSRARSSGHAQLYMTHASERGAAARKSRRVSRIAGVEKFVVSVVLTPTCNTSSPLKLVHAKPDASELLHPEEHMARQMWAVAARRANTCAASPRAPLRWP